MEENLTDSDWIDKAEAKLGYKFADKSLLETAFTHSSYYLDKTVDTEADNERLEFLGDSVLSLIVTTHLFETCPSTAEGSMTQLKEQIVDAPTLKEYTKQLGISQYCLVGKGESKNLHESGILADLFEAVLGAIYLDGGYEQANKFFLAHFREIVAKKIKSPRRNWKKDLQEYAQRELQELPEYVIEEETGPSHKRQFRISVKVQENVVGTGAGMSKKEAEMQAAKDAMEKKEKGQWQ